MCVALGRPRHQATSHLKAFAEVSSSVWKIKFNERQQEGSNSQKCRKSWISTICIAVLERCSWSNMWHNKICIASWIRKIYLFIYVIVLILSACQWTCLCSRYPWNLRKSYIRLYVYTYIIYICNIFFIIQYHIYLILIYITKFIFVCCVTLLAG